MKKFAFKAAVVSVAMGALIGIGMTASTASAEDKFVTIGTGGQTGVYYVVGGSICRLVNRGTKESQH